MNIIKSLLELFGRKMFIAFLALSFIFLITIVVLAGGMFTSIDFTEINSFLVNVIITLGGIIAVCMGANAATYFGAKTPNSTALNSPSMDYEEETILLEKSEIKEFK